MDHTNFDRFAVVVFASPPIQEQVEAIRREAPPSGRPMMAAHVTVKGSFVEPIDFDQIADWTRHCCAAAEPLVIHAAQHVVWGNEADGLATIALTVEPSAALVRLQWHLVEHLRGLARTDYYGEDIGSYHPHLTLVQDIPLAVIDEALAVIERHQPRYACEVREAALCGRRKGVAWEPIRVYPLGSRDEPTNNGAA